MAYAAPLASTLDTVPLASKAPYAPPLTSTLVASGLTALVAEGLSSQASSVALVAYAPPLTSKASSVALVAYAPPRGSKAA